MATNLFLSSIGLTLFVDTVSMCQILFVDTVSMCNILFVDTVFMQSGWGSRRTRVNQIKSIVFHIVIFY